MLISEYIKPIEAPAAGAIQQRHLQEALAGSLKPAAAEDPNDEESELA